MDKPTESEMLAQMKTYHDEVAKIVAEMQPQIGNLPYPIQFVIAGDYASMRRVQAEIKAGTLDPMRLYAVGSYARWDHALWLLKNGYVDDATFLPLIAETWRGADPDDTSHENFSVWLKFWSLNGGSYIRDGGPLPRGEHGGFIRIFRGGRTEAEVTNGFAWTTNPKIADKFARGAGIRSDLPGGFIGQARIHRGHVLAYITGRGESEVIADPYHVRDLKVTARER